MPLDRTEAHRHKRPKAEAGDMRNKKRREWHTAIHEAGHAVIGRVLGTACGKVTA
jgi:hypothetical protein